MVCFQAFYSHRVSRLMLLSLRLPDLGQMHEKPGVGKSESGGGAHKHVALALHVISARIGHVARSELQLFAYHATATDQLIFYESTRQLPTILDSGSYH